MDVVLGCGGWGLKKCRGLTTTPTILLLASHPLPWSVWVGGQGLSTCSLWPLTWAVRARATGGWSRFLDFFWGLLGPDFAVAEGEPAGGGGFALGVELDAFLALDVEVAEERVVPPGEGEVGEWGGDADVDADHAGGDVAAEFAGGFSGVGEDGGTVAEGLAVGGGDGVFE